MTTLRITAGTLRGRRIPVPKSDLRPTSERARQAFFNIVGERILDARFLDLFAGSGAFSFEAISRGARSATAVDLARTHVASISRTATGLALPVTPLQGDAIAILPRLGSEPFDLVYADPPYGFEKYDELLTAIDTQLPLTSGALVAIEHRKRTTPFAIALQRLQPSRVAEYGEVWITFFIA